MTLALELLTGRIKHPDAEYVSHFVIADEEIAHTVKAASDRRRFAAMHSACRGRGANIPRSAFYYIRVLGMSRGDSKGDVRSEHEVREVHNAVYSVTVADLTGVLRA